MRSKQAHIVQIQALRLKSMIGYRLNCVYLPVLAGLLQHSKHRGQVQLRGVDFHLHEKQQRR